MSLNSTIKIKIFNSCSNELLLDKSTLAQELSTAEQIELRQLYQQQVTSSNAVS